LPLVKSPTMTPRKMAANRANAKKSTGPRTPEGQRRVMLNGLQHGGRSPALRTNLIKAGQSVDLFDWIHERVREEMPLAKPRVAEHLARRVWCGVSLDRSTSQGPKGSATHPSVTVVCGLDAVARRRPGDKATIHHDIDRSSNFVPPRRVKDSDSGPKQPAPADVLGPATPGNKGATARDRLARDCRLGDDGHAPTPRWRATAERPSDSPPDGSPIDGLRGTLEPTRSTVAPIRAHSLLGRKRATIKATMYCGIKQIRKLRSYRQEPPRSLRNTLIIKDISFRV